MSCSSGPAAIRVVWWCLAAAVPGVSCAWGESGRTNRPNFLVVFTDQQQAKMVSAYGGFKLSTPAMDSIARCGIRFTRAFCATPQCSPSRAALLTGRWPHEVGMMGNLGNPSEPLGPTIPTAGVVFSKAGYHTAYFGKWHLGNSPAKHGFAAAPPGEKDEQTAQAAVEYLRSAGRRPFLAYVSFVNPHDVYGNPKRGERRYDAADIELPANFVDDLSRKPWPHRHFLEADQGRKTARFDREDWKQYLADYRRLTEKVDGHVGQVLGALREGGHENDTVVIFTSDHGDLGASHGLPYKCPAMYEELVRIPLLISWGERFRGGQAEEELVSLVDVLPTMCELAGIEGPTGMRGRSLVPLLEGRRPAWRDAVFAEYYGKQKWVAPIRMIRTNRWKYCLYQRHGEELYDLQDDPGEVENLAGDPRAADVRKDLRTRLEAWMRETNDPFELLKATDRDGSPLAER